MPTPLRKPARKGNVAPAATGVSMRDRLDRLTALRGHARIKPNKSAHPQPGANAKAVQAKARRAATVERAED